MNLPEIISQLKACGYSCEAGALENNVAFIELEKMATADSTVRFTISLPVDVYDWLCQQADRHNRSNSKEIVYILRRAIPIDLDCGMGTHIFDGDVEPGDKCTCGGAVWVS